ncbi:hypothetical protein ACXYTJ_12635 [Gilvimarinus sp. F26214L]|uniref:hypothetical protein n=1 Tax=Gilvimarinus sp. DZF01 TaxID=3461371 RepID=UPI0040452E54
MLGHSSILPVLAAVLFLSACASAPYEYGTGRMHLDGPLSPPMEQQFYIGEPHAFLDHADWIWPESLLRKLILLDPSIDSHQISPETLGALRAYIDDNELHNVQVLVNCYKPGNQWMRLFKNRAVAGGWRFTLGILSVVSYTIFPGRFFGGDAYNPYTNTIYLYSDNINVALHEAGHAKDFGRRANKGLHAGIYALPLAALYYEHRASSDALSYLQDQDNSFQQAEAYKDLYPAYGTYIAGNLTRNASEPLAAQLMLMIPAHIAGRIAASRVDRSGFEAPPGGSVDLSER